VVGRWIGIGIGMGCPSPTSRHSHPQSLCQKRGKRKLGGWQMEEEKVKEELDVLCERRDELACALVHEESHGKMHYQQSEGLEGSWGQNGSDRFCDCDCSHHCLSSCEPMMSFPEILGSTSESYWEGGQLWW